MRSKFIKITSGWIPVSVMLLFAASLVTGDPRSGLRGESAVTDAPPADLHEEIRSTLKNARSVRTLVDSLGHLPGQVELIIDAGVSSAGKAPRGAGFARGYDHE